MDENIYSEEKLKKVLEEYADQTTYYLNLEMEKEVDIINDLLKNETMEELQDRGLIIPCLYFSECKLTCYGQYEVIFKRSIKSFKYIILVSTKRQQKVFVQGDLVQLYLKDDKNIKIRGWINYINEYELSIIMKEDFEEKIPKEKQFNQFILLKLYDSSFKTVFDVLDKFKNL
jgi:hypothetical protein